MNRKIAKTIAAMTIMPAIAAAQMNDQKSGVMPPPQVISIGLEQIKHGKASAHEKNEIAWVQALIRAKYHEFWALESLTGPSEVMWLIPFPSYGALEANYKMATATTRVRPGHNSDYFDLLKTINEARKTATSDTHAAVYEVTSGAPSGTFLTFILSKSLAEMDTANPALTQATVDVQQRINELVEKAVVETSSVIYAFNPKMSNPSEQIVAADPAFWKPKVTMAKATASADAKTAAKKENKP
jgi:hypothetical protein